jgi:hypothetical protein
MAMISALASGHPQAGGFVTRHQARRKAKPNARPRQHKCGNAVGHCKPHAAERSKTKQSSLHPARAVTVEQHTQRKLKQAEREQIGRGEQTQPGRPNAKIPLQLRHNDGVDGAQQLARKITAGKGPKRQQHQAPGQGLRGNCHGIRPA